MALQDTAAAVFLPPGIVDVAAVCWGLDVADGLASEASDEEGLSAARAAFARAAPLAADLGARYGDSSAGLRLLLARRIGRLADLDAAAALFALAALADGDDSRFAVARSVAHSNARRPDRALQVLRAADDRADDATLHTARMRVFEALWAQGDRKACAQLPVTFRDEKALAEALAPKARGGDRAAGDCLVAALLRRRRVADAQRLRPFASPRALKALDVAKASHVSAEPLEGRYCPYLSALEQGASTKMADEDPARVDVWPAAPDNDQGEDQVMRERPQQRREDQGGGEDDEASHEGPAHVVAAPSRCPLHQRSRASPSRCRRRRRRHIRSSTASPAARRKVSTEVNVASPVDEGRADARAALEARIRDQGGRAAPAGGRRHGGGAGGAGARRPSPWRRRRRRPRRGSRWRRASPTTPSRTRRRTSSRRPRKTTRASATTTNKSRRRRPPTMMMMTTIRTRDDGNDAPAPVAAAAPRAPRRRPRRPRRTSTRGRTTRPTARRRARVMRAAGARATGGQPGDGAGAPRRRPRARRGDGQRVPHRGQEEGLVDGPVPGRGRDALAAREAAHAPGRGGRRRGRGSAAGGRGAPGHARRR